jgi:uncharacterized protein
MSKYLATSIIGLVGGYLGSMMGFSGAFFIVPMLLLFNVCSTQLSAQGTTLCMLLPPISAFAVYTYYKNNHIDFNVAFLLISFYMAGTVMGSNTAVRTSERTLRIYFATLLLFLSAYMFYTVFTGRRVQLNLE